jgi:hypothetical protein
MNLNVKALTLLLSAGIVFSLSGCGGSSSTSTDSEPGPGEVGYQVISEDNKTVTYLDANLNERNATVTTGAAEYHTGLGYGNTLFDSADNKCMNCHNELYDTWKNSMHGKSWTDPIFQSKMQDFLRTHIKKIGEDNTAKGGLLYTEKMFKGAAQTCIKCHAPGAYYAGDFKIDLEPLKIGSVTTADLAAAQLSDQDNSIYTTGTFNTALPTSVVAVSENNDTLYKATFQIGHEANQEGINCAFCHSIETPRLMRMVDADGIDATDGGIYKLVKDMRVGPHGPIKAAAGTELAYDVNASSPDMNKFFRLWGPEKYAAYHATPKGGVNDPFDVGKQPSGDGRYTMASKDINGTGGKVHFTGGPFYGPYGVTGTSNENETDETNRSAQVNPHYDVDGNNHFGESGKGLCLSCHQRSAGAALPGANTDFMELCSTQIAVSTNGLLGQDNGSEDTDSSPKCQKCHMERIEGTVLHQWARPDKLFTLADNPALTAHFDPEDPESYGDDNPVAAGWLNSHAFLGASKTGQASSVTAKIQSGFDSDLNTSTSIDGKTLTVETRLTNLTAHMFPGAHPMRRVLTRVIVTSDQGDINVTSSNGTSKFTDIENNVQPLAGKVLHSSALNPVTVLENGSADLTFPGKAPDLDGTTVNSQKFDLQKYVIPGSDTTLASQTVTNGKTEGTATNAAIVNSSDLSDFTRIYGHETGKRYNGIFIVRPGFDSNVVPNDNRLSPNETETYTLTYDISGKTGVSVTYKVYYMQTGANGKFLPLGEDGFLKTENLTPTEAELAKKLKITEVATHSVAL